MLTHVASTPLDLEPFGTDDPPGTKYAFDITEFVTENAPGGLSVLIRILGLAYTCSTSVCALRTSINP